MWCPEGYYSWSHVVGQLYNLVEELLFLVCFDGVPATEGRDEKISERLVEHFLVKRGFAENGAEARLIIDITVAYLLVQFIEEYPPTLATAKGDKIAPQFPLMCHKDQLDLCYFTWPIKGDTQYANYFDYLAKQGPASPRILDRFVFVDSSTGLIRAKNGAVPFLVNGLGFNEDSANFLLEVAMQLRGNLVCWKELPEGKELRSFLGCIEASDIFTTSLDVAFGDVLLAPEEDCSDGEPTRQIGRPKKRIAMAECYRSLFPNGHEAEKLTWKDAARAVEKKIGGDVVVTTLVRGLKEVP